MKRRRAIHGAIMGTAAFSISSCSSKKEIFPKHFVGNKNTLKKNIQHSACRWCYNGIPLEQFAEAAQELGLKSIELLDPDEWKTVQDKGLSCALSNGSPLHIPKGFNDKKYHKQLHADYEILIQKAATAGIKQIICFSGNRNGISDEKGLENCAIGLEPVVKLAAKYDIVITMELLNSKVDHADYQCDHTAWGATLADKLGLDNFKLLYDIYHMQIMEGDVIATIRKYKDYISHYHTGGVPGRNEINVTQELYYPAIMQAIVETEFTGYVSQEFIPTRKNPIESLKEGIHICDV